MAKCSGCEKPATWIAHYAWGKVEFLCDEAHNALARLDPTVTFKAVPENKAVPTDSIMERLYPKGGVDFVVMSQARRFTSEVEKQTFDSLWRRWEALAEYLGLNVEQRKHMANLALTSYENGMDMGRMGHNISRFRCTLEAPKED